MSFAKYLRDLTTYCTKMGTFIAVLKGSLQPVDRFGQYLLFLDLYQSCTWNVVCMTLIVILKFMYIHREFAFFCAIWT